MKYIFCLALFFSISLFAAEIESTPETYINGENQKLLYRLYSPKNLKENEKVPLIIFLHGSGQRGDDNLKQTTHGFNSLAQYSQENNQPCFIIAPQCPLNMKWVEATEWTKNSFKTAEKPSLPIKLTLELIEQKIKDSQIDSNRIYITGLSLGGYGTWDAIARKPELFAAAIPICGGADLSMAKKLAHLPIWAIHGSDDKVISVEQTRAMINALKEAGGKPNYTERAGEGHNVWTVSYNDKKLLDWLFAQKKSAK